MKWKKRGKNLMFGRRFQRVHTYFSSLAAMDFSFHFLQKETFKVKHNNWIYFKYMLLVKLVIIMMMQPMPIYKTMSSVNTLPGCHPGRQGHHASGHWNHSQKSQVSP
jgi:hypothetical protein